MPRTAKFNYDYKKGTPWPYETLISQFDFPILKTEEHVRARLDTPDGYGAVPWYSSPYAEEPAGETPAGTEVYLNRVVNGRALYTRYEWDGERYADNERWYPSDSVLPVTGSVFFAWSYNSDGFRERTGDTRVLGVLEAEAPLAPVRVLDAPGGNELAHLYGGEQAEVLEERDGFLRVRTVRLEGWIAAENFKEIRQEGN